MKVGCGGNYHISKSRRSFCSSQDFEAELNFECDFYAKDVKKLDLQTQLTLLRAMMIELHASDTSKLTLKDIVKSVQDISEVQKVSLCHV